MRTFTCGNHEIKLPLVVFNRCFDRRDTCLTTVDGMHWLQTTARIRNDDIRFFLDEQPVRRFE